MLKTSFITIAATGLAISAIFSGCAASKYEKAANMSKLQVSFADATWNGKNIPVGHRCTDKSSDKNPMSPALNISNIPANTNALIISYSDSSYQPMDNGGHGVMMYMIGNSSNTVTVPSVAGHAETLPSGFKIISSNQSGRYTGAYLPPCSGGKGNLYYVTVQAVREAKENAKLLGEGELDLGRY